MSRNYMIIPSSQLGDVDFSQVCETSAETVRKSVDGTKTFIKWDGDEPSFLSSLTDTEGPYTNAQLTDILATDAWTSDGDS